jgi:hypothetical protein
LLFSFALFFIIIIQVKLTQSLSDQLVLNEIGSFLLDSLSRPAVTSPTQTRSDSPRSPARLVSPPQLALSIAEEARFSPARKRSLTDEDGQRSSSSSPTKRLRTEPPADSTLAPQPKRLAQPAAETPAAEQPAQEAQQQHQQQHQQQQQEDQVELKPQQALQH